jgi:hypothetical protein
MMKPTQIDWARLAAYLDGEGTIVIIKSRLEYTQLVIRVANTDPRLPMWCKELFGGKVYASDTNVRRDGRSRRFYTWAIQSQKAENILRECLPHFILKREQAEIALAYRETFVHVKGRTPLQDVTPSKKAIRQQYKEELSRLKHELPAEAFVGAPEPPPFKGTIQ